MSQEFLITGIQDGQIIEASEVSQSVDAFSGTKAYDIDISGSLTFSGSTVSVPQGSIRLTGSLINDGSGQFSHIGLANPSLPNQYALNISGESPLFDPKVLIEGSNTKFPQIQIANEDTNWALRIKDVMGDFEVVQSASSAGGENLTPFRIQRSATPSSQYYLYLVSSGAGNIKSGNIGIGFGTAQNVPNIVNGLVSDNALGYGSLAVFNTVSGSFLKSSTISASATTGGPVGSPGENIHGTASYTTYIETAQTASYAAAENPLNTDSIAFFYNIDSSTSPNNNSQINSTHLNALTGSTGILKLDSNNVTTMDNFGEGLYIGNPTDNYHVVISGSCGVDDGIAWIGNPYSQNFSKPPFIQIQQESTASKGFIKLGDQLGGSSQIIFSRDPNAGFDSEDLTVHENVTVSGSGNNKVEMDGYDPGNFVLFASSSLVPNDLKFDVSNNGVTADSVARIANMNTSVTSQLSFQIGSAPHSSNSILEISSSDDVLISQGSLNYGNIPPPAGDEVYPTRELHAYESLGRDVNSGNNLEVGTGYERSVQCKPLTTSSGISVVLISFLGDDSVGFYPTSLGNGNNSQMYIMEISSLGAGPTASGGIFIKTKMVVRWDSSANMWQIISQGVTSRMRSAGYSNTFSNHGLTGFGGSVLNLIIQPNTGFTTKWATWVNIKTPGPKYDAP